MLFKRSMVPCRGGWVICDKINNSQEALEYASFVREEVYILSKVGVNRQAGLCSNKESERTRNEQDDK